MSAAQRVLKSSAERAERSGDYYKASVLKQLTKTIQIAEARELHALQAKRKALREAQAAVDKEAAGYVPGTVWLPVKPWPKGSHNVYRG